MDSGDPDFAQVSRVYEDVRDAINPAIADLRDLVARIEAESEAEATDEAAPVEVAS
jgi:hypothetical protein